MPRNWGLHASGQRTRRAVRPKWTPLAALAIPCAMILLVILTGCASPTPTPPPVATTESARPLICSETAAISYHLGKITPDGKPDLTAEDIRAALARPDAVAYVRRLTGDTSDTIERIKIHNAVMDRLCTGEPK